MSFQVFRAITSQLSSSCFAISLMSKRLVNLKVSNLNVEIKYVIHLLFDVHQSFTAVPVMLSNSYYDILPLIK